NVLMNSDLDLLPEGQQNELQKVLAEIQPFFGRINGFSVGQPNPTEVRNQPQSQIRGAYGQLYTVTAAYIGLLLMEDTLDKMSKGYADVLTRFEEKTQSSSVQQEEIKKRVEEMAKDGVSSPTDKQMAKAYKSYNGVSLRPIRFSCRHHAEGPGAAAM